jgi:hypothetical protein
MADWIDPIIQLEIPGLPAVEGPPKKRCPHCRTVKTAGEFSCDRSRPDGLTRICRQCDNDRHKQRRAKHGDLLRVRERRRYSERPEQKRQAAADYRRTDRGRKLNLASVRRYRERNAEKHAAHVEVRRAIAAGILMKPDRCELAHLGECAGRIEAHHPDYARPLEVRWLCASHHNVEHHKPRIYFDPHQPHLFHAQRTASHE